MKTRHRETKHTEVITKEDEDHLWTSNFIGIHDPISLLRAVFFYNGRHLCLRGGMEHRDLKLSQFKRVHNPEGYIHVYTQNFHQKTVLEDLRI